jgi:hypothetical protein
MSKRDESPVRKYKPLDLMYHRNQWKVEIHGYLTYGKFPQLPDQLLDLSVMEDLDMMNNELQTLDPVLGKLTWLKQLELSHNPIAFLPPSIGNLTRLVTLDLTKLPIVELPNEIAKLSSLFNLKVTDCPISNVPSGIGLMNLRTLRLLNTNLTVLPDELFSLKYLDFLDIRQNAHLVGLSPKIGQLERLAFFTMNSTPLITHVPCELYQCKKLWNFLAQGNPQLKKDVYDGGLGWRVQRFSRETGSHLQADTLQLHSLLRYWKRLFQTRKQKRELLVYFYLALECDIPILEAFWIGYPRPKSF